jgi:hypothetical protein
MLTAYFDDSGTHDGSDIVLLAGLFGHGQQWDFFAELWRKRLDESVPGKLPVQTFHMYDCQNSANAFAGWNRTETSFLSKELSDIFFRVGLWGCSCSMQRKAWDELITGDVRRASGDAEGSCARVVFNTTLEWAAEFGGSNFIAFVFDDRPHRKREYEAIYQIYSDHRNAIGLKPQLASLTFARAVRSPPLQGADLFAWEVYQDELHFFRTGIPRKGQFQRKLLARMAQSGRFRIQSGDRDAIVRNLHKAEAHLKASGGIIADDLDKYFGEA